MSILDTFFIMFDGDTTKLDKSLKKANKTADEATKNLRTTDTVASSVGESFKELIGSMGAAVVAGLSVAGVIKGVSDAANFTDQLGKLSDAYGLNIKTMSAWGDAVAMSGGTAQGFQSSITSLSNDFQQLALTGQSSAMPFLARLGISMYDTQGHIKKVTSILPELAEKFKGMSTSKSMAIGKKLGLDSGTIMLLQQGKTAVLKQVEAMKKLDGVSKESALNSARFHNATAKLGFAMRGLFIEIGNEVLPALTWFNKILTKVVTFVRDNKVIMTGVFIALGAAITMYALPAMISLAASTIAAAAPFLIIIALVAAVGAVFALVYDDIMNFIEGNNSLIGTFINKYPKIGKVLKAVGNSFKELWEIIKAIFGFIIDAIESPIKTLENLEKKLDDIGKKIKKYTTGIGHTVVAGAKHLGSEALTGAKHLGSKVMSFFGFGGEKKKAINHDDWYVKWEENHQGLQPGPAHRPKNTIDTAKKTLAGANSYPLNNSTMNSTSNDNKTTVAINSIEIHTQAKNAQDISKDIHTALKQHIGAAINNYNDGVDR